MAVPQYEVPGGMHGRQDPQRGPQRMPRDCSAVVLDGVWPYELMTPRPETETVARYLHEDLMKIVERTNERLAEMDRWTHMPYEQRRDLERRAIDVARALAVLRVESTVRSLGGRAITVSPKVVEVTKAIEADLMQRPGAGRPNSAGGRGAPRQDGRPTTPPPHRDGAGRPAPGGGPAHGVPQPGARPAPVPPPRPPVPPPPNERLAAPRPAAGHFVDADESQTDEYEPAVASASNASHDTRPMSGPQPVVIVDADEPDDDAGETTEVVARASVLPDESTQVVARETLRPDESTQVVAHGQPAVEETTPVVRPAEVRPAPAPVVASAEVRPAPAPVSRGHVEGRASFAGPDQLQEWLQQVTGIVARQQPALKWVVGERADGSIVVATDVMSGWVPPGVVLPAGVVVLEPARRSGKLEEWVGPLERSARYGPGDRIAPSAVPALAEKPFAVVEIVEDLGWRLGEATRLHEGLPRIAHTLAKAGAAHTGVPEAELDVLAVHVQTATQSMLAAYPSVSEAQVLSCMLLGAAEAMAAGHTVLASYHYAWYETLAGRRWE
ncbi:DUF5631 domain-containing protein [Mycolicibacterium novocastrense]|uniref:DUF5631 domain-containing protein n=1 Tax=Mycolicibacterium novocastrense TaxID=59813 RepID=A0AAW5SST7_MYCNV|nr:MULTISPECIES: DUF5631 domain-containing protein [Mycolicibacterium]MCV7026630.1 DUF5631 domain-containing protein [Mycolicibacterium novocastrense]MDX1887502.1 DUF5631 domain-containing protein [Mycolicibacterium sp. 120270]GAT07617.1 uncharacterized protein RMCN_0750 [Mycolicibacterium novocastrense]